MALRPNSPQVPANKFAERQAAEQDVFLREVDDAVRQDQMLGAAKRYGAAVAAVVIAGLLALAGYLWWDHSKNEDAAKRGEQFTIALDKLQGGDLAKADAELKPLSEKGGNGSQAAAAIMRGGIALEQGRKADAVKLFAAVAADESAPKPFRDLASIREVATNFEAMKPDDVVARLKPLAVPGNPWFGSAGELVGMAYLKQGKNDLAGPLFAAISRDKTVPETLRRRARQLAGLLGVDAIDDVNQAASGNALASANSAGQQ